VGGCVEPELVIAFAAGRLPAESAARVENHLDRCNACRAAVAAVASMDTTRSQTEEVTAPSPGSEEPRSVSTFASGDLVAGRYRIARMLGEGGMGEVYEATDLELDTRVALKTIRSQIASDRRAVERFKREITIARRITHPNVCRLFDLGFHPAQATTAPSADRVSFFTMEFLDGETLGHAIRLKGPMTEEQALPLVEQMAAALDAAHALGVVHRDFKSQNVMLVPTRSGVRAVVTDFGLARDLQATDGYRTSHLALGSPAYMAPEQVAGQQAGPRADVYALGVVLFELVTGRLPFQAETPMLTAIKRLTEAAPDPRTLRAQLDPRWAATLLRCLERDAGRRFGSAGEVLENLGRAGTRARPGANALRRRFAFAVAATLAIGAASLGFRAATSGPPSSAVEPEREAPPTAAAAASMAHLVVSAGAATAASEPASRPSVASESVRAANAPAPARAARATPRPHAAPAPAPAAEAPEEPAKLSVPVPARAKDLMRDYPE
jgi:hypothetical protein